MGGSPCQCPKLMFRGCSELAIKEAKSQKIAPKVNGDEGTGSRVQEVVLQVAVTRPCDVPRNRHGRQAGGIVGAHGQKLLGPPRLAQQGLPASHTILSTALRNLQIRPQCVRVL